MIDPMKVGVMVMDFGTNCNAEVRPRCLWAVPNVAKVLAEDFVKPGRLTETKAVDLGRHLLRDNVSRIFGV